MAGWLNLGQHLKINAKKFPDKVAVKDRRRSFTYPRLNRRTNRLAHSLLGLGLTKGDKVAVLLENCIEIVEIYLATAKTGLIIVPINFRLAGNEIEYIADNSDARAMVVHDLFATSVAPIKDRLTKIPADNYIMVGQTADGYREYETFIENASPDDP
ncbi:MAG: AMP-binding protein, partial [Desulfobacteraceae bacterium]